MKEILTVEEAAIYLQVDTSTIYKQCHYKDHSDGPIPHFHLGLGKGSIRIRKDLLDLWIIGISQCENNKLIIDFRDKFINNLGKEEVKVDIGHSGEQPHV